MFAELVSIIKEIKDLSIKKILILLFSSALLIGVWKFDIVVDSLLKVQKSVATKEPKKSSSVLYDVSSDSGISAENLNRMRTYLAEYLLDKFPKYTYSVSIFKFLPPGSVYSYQGRMLVAFKSRYLTDQEEEIFLKELNVNWIPIWSGRQGMELVLDGSPSSLRYDGDSQTYRFQDSFDYNPASNYLLLGESGIKSIFRYPVIAGGNTVGYLSVYLTDELTKDKEQEIKKVSSQLASKVVNYLVDGGK